MKVGENHEKLDLIRIANLRLSDNPSSVSNNEINIIEIQCFRYNFQYLMYLNNHII